MKNGYVTCAFGLKLRTPLLARCKGSSNITSEAGAETRSAVNARSQSYGMLLRRALNEFVERIEASPYVNDIRLFNEIHDCLYAMV